MYSFLVPTANFPPVLYKFKENCVSLQESRMYTATIAKPRPRTCKQLEGIQGFAESLQQSLKTEDPRPFLIWKK